LPGFANFPGEILVFFGSWKPYPEITVLACWGALVIGAVYMLRAIRAILHGSAETSSDGSDLAHIWQKLPYALLLAALMVFGIFPRLLTDKINPRLKELVGQLDEPTGVAAGFHNDPSVATKLPRSRWPVEEGERVADPVRIIR